MKTIKIQIPKNSKWISNLSTLYNIFKGLKPNEQVTFDLSNMSWCAPSLILPIAAYLDHNHGYYVFSKNQNINDYLKTIHFPVGLHKVSQFSKWNIKNTFTPISVLVSNNINERQKLIDAFLSLFDHLVAPIEGKKNAIYYPISELVANIIEHSHTEKGFVFGQYYPKKGFLDVAIVDCGRGLAQSFQKEKGVKVSDAEAISQVMSGVSTKDENERGYGVHTSIDIICEGMKGDFALITGSCAYVNSNKKIQLINLPGFYWQGVIITYRIPKPTAPIDITPYLE